MFNLSGMEKVLLFQFQINRLQEAIVEFLSLFLYSLFQTTTPALLPVCKKQSPQISIKDQRLTFFTFKLNLLTALACRESYMVNYHSSFLRLTMGAITEDIKRCIQHISFSALDSTRSYPLTLASSFSFHRPFMSLTAISSLLPY